MLYVLNPHHYNIPQKKFLSDHFYTSYSRVGNYLIDGYVGPDCSTAFSKHKLLSMKKAHSEILERRSLAAGGMGRDTKVPSLNLINNEAFELEWSLSTFSDILPYPSDTTGTASHITSEKASTYALKELIEKNALFLFWYGKQGKRLKNDNMSLSENALWKILKNKKKEVLLFINDSFSPLKVIFAFIILNNTICSSGVGSAFCLIEARKKALEEAYLLQWKNESTDLIYTGINSLKEYSNDLESMHYLYNSFDSSYIHTKEENLNLSTKNLLQTLPNWIKSVYLIPLEQRVYHKLKCVKIFSPYLYNHIPLKNYINLKNPINKNTINLSIEKLNITPECIVT